MLRLQFLEITSEQNILYFSNTVAIDTFQNVANPIEICVHICLKILIGFTQFSESLRFCGSIFKVEYLPSYKAYQMIFGNYHL